MWASLSKFQRDIESLRNEILALQKQWALLSLPSKQSNGAEPTPDEVELSGWKEVIGSGVFRRRFEYNSVVVTLYGLFERYLEELLVEYLEKLQATIPAYSKFPEKIKTSHIEMTTAILGKPDLQKFRTTLSTAGLVSNLNSCLQDLNSYCINVEAFTYHTANFRIESIDQFFSKIGINAISRQCLKTAGFLKFLSEAYPDRIKMGRDGEIFSEINDLADRRNEVAHGAASTTLSLSILEEYLTFISAYGAAIAEVLQSEYLRFEVMHNGRFVGEPIAVYNNSIICVQLAQTRVRCGDRVIGCFDEERTAFREGIVETIEVANIPYSELTCRSPIDVAIKVNFRAGKIREVYLVEPAATPWELT